MVIKYWKAVHKRALKEARHALWIETGERAVIAIAVIGLSIVLLWIVGGRELATTEIIIRATVTAAFIFVFPFVYLWKLHLIMLNESVIALAPVVADPRFAIDDQCVDTQLCEACRS
jgi:hypothetical protein